RTRPHAQAPRWAALGPPRSHREIPPNRIPGSGSGPTLCRLSVIILEQSAQSLPTANRPSTGNSGWARPSKQQLVVFALMVPLGVVMIAEIRKRVAQRAFAEQDQLGKTLTLH